MTETDDEFYRRQDRKKMLADLHTKMDRGERLTREELVEVFSDHAVEIDRRVRDEMKRCRTNPERARPVAYTQGTADSIRTGFSDVIGEMMAMSLAQYEKRRALEDRVAALEALIAPRSGKVRVRAPSRPIQKEIKAPLART